MLWQSVYVAIGSNLDGPVRQVQDALAALAAIADTRLVLQSSLYGSKPWGFAEQPDFVNAVAALLTQLPLQEFFQAMKALERQLGRKPVTLRWGPRRIDLDLLLFGQQRLDSPELRLPHPAIAARSFVLYPLRELAPDLVIPGGARIADLAARVDGSGIWRLDEAAMKHGA